QVHVHRRRLGHQPGREHQPRGAQRPEGKQRARKVRDDERRHHAELLHQPDRHADHEGRGDPAERLRKGAAVPQPAAHQRVRPAGLRDVQLLDARPEVAARRVPGRTCRRQGTARGRRAGPVVGRAPASVPWDALSILAVAMSAGCPRVSPVAGRELSEIIDPDWAEALEPVAGRIAAMGDFLRTELAAGRRYLPAGEHVLRAFTQPFGAARVLIVRQDPSPTPGHAVGLSFSVAPTVRRLPPSLLNIFREYSDDLGYPAPATGDLVPWTERGVLLLNRVLTVQPRQ